MNRLSVAALIVAACPAFAENPSPVVGTTEGEVRSVDHDARKLTLRHGEIKSLDMPAMTMVFQVRQPSMLDDLKAGDRVRVAIEKNGNAFFVTRLEPVK